MNLSDYLLDQEGKDWPALLSEWRSELPEEFTLWLVNRFGDLLIVADDGSVRLLDVGSGSLVRLADSRDDFGLKLDQGDNASQWLLIPIVDACVEKGLRLGSNDCYGFKVPPSLGGNYDLDNIEPTDLAVHCSVLAQIHAKTKSLAAGTKIGKVGIE